MSVARAYFREEEDRDAILKALTGHEISPGYILNASALPRTKDSLKKGYTFWTVLYVSGKVYLAFFGFLVPLL